MNVSHKTLVAIAGGLFVFILAFLLFQTVVIDKIADRVIDRMIETGVIREYAPGPYHPGINPDKLPSAYNGR